MAWTAPRTWVTGETVTAALLNTHVRDNLLETAPAKVTTAGDTVYATGANAIARLGIGTRRYALRVNAGATAPAWSGPGEIGKIKAADESITSSTSLQDDDELVIAVPANETIIWELVLFVIGATSGDIKIQITWPTSTTMGPFQLVGQQAGGTAGVTEGSDISDAGGFALDAAGSPGLTHILRGVVYTTQAGNATFRWAQNSSNGTATTVKKGSMLRLWLP